MNKQSLVYSLEGLKDDPFSRGGWKVINDIAEEYLKGQYKVLFNNITDCNKFPEQLKFVVFDWENIKILAYREPNLIVYTYKDYNEAIKALRDNEQKLINEGMKKEKDHFKKVMLFKDIGKHKIKSIKRGETEIKAGDFLSTCWGYDQTNVELFVIKKIIGKNYFIIQEVSQQTGTPTETPVYDMVKVSDSVIKIDLPQKAYISNDGYMSICEYGYKRGLSLTNINKEHYKTNSQFGH